MFWHILKIGLKIKLTVYSNIARDLVIFIQSYYTISVLSDNSLFIITE